MSPRGQKDEEICGDAKKARQGDKADSKIT